jgi:hypothetical protein
MMRVDLVRDVLDTQLLDAHRVRLGKVDGLVLELPRGKQPRISAIRVGSYVWARRMGRPWGVLAAWMSRTFWGDERGEWEIPWSAVAHMGKNIQLHREASRVPSLGLERWLAKHVIGRIPGSSRGEGRR